MQKLAQQAERAASLHAIHDNRRARDDERIVFVNLAGTTFPFLRRAQAVTAAPILAGRLHG